MRKIHCDLCQKLIKPEEEDYYEIDEISFNSHEDQGIADKGQSKSWVTWPSFDFCARCWLSKDFEILRMLIKKREEKE